MSSTSTGFALDGARAAHVQHQLIGFADGGLEPHRTLRRVVDVVDLDPLTKVTTFSVQLLKLSY